jgi:hypothetical protein
MSLKGGNNVFNQFPKKNVHRSGPGYSDAGNGGGNSGAVISPAPGLGLSAYQDPKVPVGPLPKRQGGS